MLNEIRTVEGYNLITLQEAANRMGGTLSMVTRWVNKGILPVRAKIGRVNLVDARDVELASNTVLKRKPRRNDKRKRDIRRKSTRWQAV